MRAEAAGAERIELVAAISEGGLTPSLGALREVRRRCSLPVSAMLRPRGGGFVYSEAEFATMLVDAGNLLDEGSDALVVGMLTANGELDAKRMRQFVDLAADRPVVCHRAFDKAPNLKDSLKALIEIGVRRVLTSGGHPTALDGAAHLRGLIELAAGRIEILPGGGIRSANAKEVLAATGATQIHLGPFRPAQDAFSGDTATHLTLDEDEVKRTRSAIDAGGS